MRIIIVDDREEERYLAETLLKGSGYEVVTAVNGAEALEKLRTEGFDMIVSDVLMPVMDGFRLCRECKRDEKLKDIPFIFCTATYKDERDEELASKVGADKYIRKPIEAQEFVKIIQGLVRDIEEGRIGPKKLVMEEEREVLKLYSERLITKLEKKMLDLEIEIKERKRAEERVEHLNLVLRAIRSVNQLIIREKERDKLLKSACNNLIKTRSYESTCICLFDESGMLVAHAEAGLNKDFLTVVERLKRGELTDCIKRTLIQSGMVLTKASSLTCDDCPLVKTCSGKTLVTVRIEHSGKVYGLLRLSLSEELSISREEQSLLQEVIGDIAFALHNMELEEERKRLEERIRRAAEEWRTTFDSITDLVSVHDKDFRLVRVNKAFADVFKMRPEELIGKSCYEIVHGTNKPMPDCPYEKTIKTKQPTTIAYFEPHLGIHLEVAASPIFNEKGGVIACVHVTRDITERIKMREQLIVTDRLASIGELASGIAHELNNPLTSVIGFSDLLLEKDMPDDIKKDLSVVNREAKRTAQVVRNLLTFARKHPEEKQSVDINKLIQNVLELRAYEQKVNNIQVNTQFAPDLPEIMANGFELQQVFLNIIINAEHFTTEAHGRGTLTITTERAGDIIQASFADDGPGIAEENLGHLFDPFFTTKEVGEGTGLGLSISYGIITEHGGRIYAESELGKGATFIVELPIPTADDRGTKDEHSP